MLFVSMLFGTCQPDLLQNFRPLGKIDPRGLHPISRAFWTALTVGRALPKATSPAADSGNVKQPPLERISL